MSLIEQYTTEIASMERSLEACKRELDYYLEQKRIHRPTARGRIANDNWNARLGNATYDLRIAASRAKIAMYKNQIALRKEAIKEERKKAKAETPQPAPKKEEPKPTPTKPATTSSADGKMTVEKLAADFKAQFGSVLRIYNGRSKADDSLSLQEVGLTGNLSLPFDGNQKVGDFIAQMEKAGLKVKVYTCDEWVAVLDGLTLTQTGQVKKSATKADMESMIAYQRTNNSLGGYTIQAKEDGGYLVMKDGVECENSKAAMREIAAIIGLEVDPSWTTRQFGAKLLKAMQ